MELIQHSLEVQEALQIPNSGLTYLLDRRLAQDGDRVWSEIILSHIVKDYLHEPDLSYEDCFEIVEEVGVEEFKKAIERRDEWRESIRK